MKATLQTQRMRGKLNQLKRVSKQLNKNGICEANNTFWKQLCKLKNARQIKQQRVSKQLNKNGICEANNTFWKEICKLKECEAN